ncbi:MAG: aldolase/citrate lyase family protein [Devosia sp.]|nr:aldolase/citrate lyase family protein [Devosia sp.]
MSGIRPNRFKRQLAERTPALGMWLSLNSLAATEIAAGAGFDWVLLDMEHGLYDIESVEHHLLAARHGGDAEFVVRVPSIDPVLVKRLLDGGVRSFMFPFVQTVADAKLAVAATRYPPHGIRGVSGINRANRYTRTADYGQRYQDDICVIVQVESPQAVAAIPEYGGIEGIDGILVGPNDLAANMGLFGQTGHADVLAKIDEALGLMLETGKGAGILDFDPAAAAARLKRGFSFAAIGGDTTMLVRGMAELLGKFRPA